MYEPFSLTETVLLPITHPYKISPSEYYIKRSHKRNPTMFNFVFVVFPWLIIDPCIFLSKT